MGNKFTKDSFIVGFALFAVFFGAGNLIFPPAIGFMAGSSWMFAFLALLLAGIALPILSIIAVSNAGGSFEELSKPIGKWFHVSFNLFVMIGVGVLATIPRTAATTHELGVIPLFPNVPIQLTVVVFFALTYYFANDKSNFIDKVGKIMTPGLIGILLLIGVKAILSPPSTPAPAHVPNPFSASFIELYFTGDLLTGLLCTPIFVSAIVSKGYTLEAERKRMTLSASLIAGAGFILVYFGLLYLGAHGGNLFPADVARTDLLNGLVSLSFGNIGTIGLSIVVVLACLSTAIGITASVADFVSSVTKNKITYKVMVAVTCIVGVIVGGTGVDSIINFAGPIFYTVYPPAIVLTFLGLFKKYVPNDGAFRYAVLITLALSAVKGLGELGVHIGFIDSLISSLPLSSQGFEWILPAIAGFFFGWILYKLTGKEIVEANVRRAN
ncbi:branched-chain amino acid transport system II carrier protein [Peribacillus alkalitolerans]|uniref:branched-chain amino acid transport system II carrier protein n=1 Tax=Peribacillus alkalitolerans TaxID=1550385 RepID=UPI0013D26F0C|nr:branched-chain amino acid transport system II carrier protein [Peribacillus alkalitolerans]